MATPVRAPSNDRQSSEAPSPAARTSAIRRFSERLSRKSLPSATKISALRRSSLVEVFLHDWWLIRIDVDSSGRRLGIGGFTSENKLGIREFHSAAIAKRHGTTTLEAVDGLTIIISGLLNRLRTLKYGFPQKVCDQFIFGFPHCWEQFVGQSLNAEATKGDILKDISASVEDKMSSDSTNSSPPLGFNHLQVTSIRDFLRLTPHDQGSDLTMKSTFIDLMQDYGGNGCKHHKTGNQRRTMDTTSGDAPKNHKKSKVEQKLKSDHNVLSIGPLTRSKTRLKAISC